MYCNCFIVKIMCKYTFINNRKIIYSATRGCDLIHIISSCFYNISKLSKSIPFICNNSKSDKITYEIFTRFTFNSIISCYKQVAFCINLNIINIIKFFKFQYNKLFKKLYRLYSNIYISTFSSNYTFF